MHLLHSMFIAFYGKNYLIFKHESFYFYFNVIQNIIFYTISLLKYIEVSRN